MSWSEYDLNVVRALRHEEPELVARFDAREVTYDFGELDELALAYALTLHKSQGSEFDRVTLLLPPASSRLLTRELLYTAITRARKLCVLAGNRKAINMAVRNNRVAARFTALEWRLAER